MCNFDWHWIDRIARQPLSGADIYARQDSTFPVNFDPALIKVECIGFNVNDEVRTAIKQREWEATQNRRQDRGSRGVVGLSDDLIQFDIFGSSRESGRSDDQGGEAA